MKTKAITRVRRSPGGHDRYGDPIASTVTETVLDGWLLAPRHQDESTERGRNGVVIGLTGFRPGLPCELLHTDEVRIDGTLYVVDGEPGDWDGSQVGGCEVAFKRAVG